jgi:hypothetical protein
MAKEGLPPNAVAEGWTGDPGTPGSQRIVILHKSGESPDEAFERVSKRHPQVKNWTRFDLEGEENPDVY